MQYCALRIFHCNVQRYVLLAVWVLKYSTSGSPIWIYKNTNLEKTETFIRLVAIWQLCSKIFEQLVKMSALGCERPLKEMRIDVRKLRYYAAFFRLSGRWQIGGSRRADGLIFTAGDTNSDTAITLHVNVLQSLLQLDWSGTLLSTSLSMIQRHQPEHSCDTVVYRWGGGTYSYSNVHNILIQSLLMKHKPLTST